MLAKLMKYEIKATARLFVPLYLTLLFFALFNRILNPFEMLDSAESFNLQVLFSLLSITAYFMLIIGTMVMTLVIMIQRFYKNLLGDEGYLMFTLPVEPWKHIISKFLVAMFWTVLSFATAMCSVLILLKVDNLFGELRRLIEQFTELFGRYALFTMPLYALIYLASGILMIYAAISLGHVFSRHKLLASFGMYFALYSAYQIVMTLYLLIFGRMIFPSIMTGSAPAFSEISKFLLSLCIPGILIMLSNYMITNIVLKKNLNLE